MQVLLGVIIDSVWPPRQSAQACAKGGLAKWIMEQKAAEVQHCLLDRDAEITVPGPAAGKNHGLTWKQASMATNQTLLVHGHVQVSKLRGCADFACCAASWHVVL